MIRIRIQRVAVGVAALSLFALSALPAAAAGGGGTGPTGGSTGGISGGGGGGTSGILPLGNCGAGNVAVVSSIAYWGGVLDPPSTTAGADGKTFAAHVWPTYKTWGVTMNFIVDATTGMVYGPPSLEGYNAALGEGWPPGFTGPFTNTNPTTAPGYDGYINYNGFNGGASGPGIGWGCYVGGMPVAYDTVPVSGSFNLTQGTAPAAKVDVASAALVYNPVNASQGAAGAACPSAPVLFPMAVQYPAPARVDYNTVPAGCPNGGVWHGTSTPAGTWQWYAYEIPVEPPTGTASGCTSGSGAYVWHWLPKSYTAPPANQTDLTSKCTPGPTDQETFTHVTPAGVKVKVSESRAWSYECIGAAKTTVDANAFWSWDLAAGQTYGPVLIDGFTWTFTCDPGFTQAGPASPGFVVDQIEPVGISP